MKEPHTESLETRRRGPHWGVSSPMGSVGPGEVMLSPANSPETVPASLLGLWDLASGPLDSDAGCMRRAFSSGVMTSLWGSWGAGFASSKGGGNPPHQPPHEDQRVPDHPSHHPPPFLHRGVPPRAPHGRSGGPPPLTDGTPQWGSRVLSWPFPWLWGPSGGLWVSQSIPGPLGC